MILVNTWKLVVLERYAKFDGRAGRAEYWWFVLANVVAWVALVVLLFIGSAIADALGILLIIVLIGYWLAMIVPSIAVGVRRLHDTNKTGWLMLLVLLGVIPIIGFVGSIVLLVFFATQGNLTANDYGEPDPGLPVAA